MGAYFAPHKCRFRAPDHRAFIASAVPSGGDRADSAEAASNEKATPRAARERVADYYQEQLRGLLEHLRAGFVSLDAGEIDEFELDDLIHRYKKAAAKLWSFCGAGGASVQQAAGILERLRADGEEMPDWWELAAPPDHRRDR